MLITGSSKGIGRGLAEYFLSQGYFVVGCSREQSIFKSDHYHHTCIDVGDEGKVRSWIRAVKKSLLRIDVLIANAAIIQAKSLLTMTSASDMEQMFRTNVTGVYNVCREVSKVMMLQQSGRIITLSSMSAGLHEEGTSAYSATKASVVEITKILAKELASSGITCNALAPSMVMTGAVDSLGESISNRAMGKLSIKRYLTIEEIAHAISFFIAPESGSITGQVLYMGLVV